MVGVSIQARPKDRLVSGWTVLAGYLVKDTSVPIEVHKKTLSLSEPPGNEAFRARNTTFKFISHSSAFPPVLGMCLGRRQLHLIYAYIHQIRLLNMLTNRSRDPVQHSYLCSTRLLPPYINRTYPIHISIDRHIHSGSSLIDLILQGSTRIKSSNWLHNQFR